jgi:3-oxoacyl-[acyl-carrier protein] reductase
MRFENQHVVVTGGTRGLGRAMSLAFLAEGAVVHATYRSDTASADALRAEAGAVSPDGAERLVTHAVDVTDDAAVAAFWEGLGEQPVSVLVNNAGIRKDSILATMKPEDWEAVIATNLSGGYRMSRHAVLNMMGQRYGRIVFVTSPAGRQGFEGQTNYGASKAGQQGLMRSLCKEVAKRGITVNCVSPGFVATELLDDLPEDLVKQYKKDVPMRRFGKPEEVASAVCYLASPEASYVTGTTLEVTGGL